VSGEILRLSISLSLELAALLLSLCVLLQHLLTLLLQPVMLHLQLLMLPHQLLVGRPAFAAIHTVTARGYIDDLSP